MLFGVLLFFILLHIALGFLVGIIILVITAKQDRWLRISGLILGWFVIALTAIFMILTSVAAITLRNTPMGGCPMCRMMQKQQKMPMMQKEMHQNMPMMENHKEQKESR